MKRNCLCCTSSSLFLLLIFSSSGNAQNAQDQGKEVIVPAGTLLRCALNEPNFSSKTADVGTPVVCPLAGLLMFDHIVFPRGSYLGGHLEADQAPGHFVGKGYLKLQFDHIGLPEGQVPVPAKIVAASGYKVDKEGKIIGRGHATRDAVEWMIPPLWPLKVLTLPARGPRPTLRRNDAVPVWYLAPQVQAPAAKNLQVAPSVKAAPSSDASGTATSVKQNVLVLRNGTSYVATGLHMDGNRLSYTQGDGTLGTVSLDDVDWTKTFQNNAENGTVLAVNSESARR
jgi:hypothetical protein